MDEPLAEERIAYYGVDGCIDTRNEIQDQRPIYVAPINDVLTDEVIKDLRTRLVESA